jgi:hypothetical protein
VTFIAPWRKLLLVLHVTSSVGFMGAVASFLALAITGAATDDALLATGAYLAMRVVTWDVIVPLAFTALVTGIVQSIGTPWGLFRYYWIIIKLVLTMIAVAVLMLQTPSVDALGDAALVGGLASYEGARFSMVVHGTGGLLVLIVANVLSVFKPRGMTRYGAAQLSP